MSEVVITSEDKSKEILLVEDSRDLNYLELFVRTLTEKGCNNVCITQESFDVLGREFKENGFRKESELSDMSFTLIYTRPQKGGGEDADLLKVGSDLKVIPLFLLVGQGDMGSITGGSEGDNKCFKKPVNMQEFINQMRKVPMYWVRMNADPEES